MAEDLIRSASSAEADADGTLLNSKSRISDTNAKALREASSRGIKVVLATGKTRPAAIALLEMVGLAGRDGIVSEYSPGVFIQGLLVYGKEGQEIQRINLDQDVCREAFDYSVKHNIPLIAFSESRCLTLFSHPLVDTLHTMYLEPKAEVMPSVEHLLSSGDVQKVVFLDTAEGVDGTLRPYWEKATNGRACVVQAQADMLEIVPPGTSKGSGVKRLLDHFGATANEVMAIGDGENDVEMMELASLGVAMSNGSEKTKAAANVIGASNDEDGVADAIYNVLDFLFMVVSKSRPLYSGIFFCLFTVGLSATLADLAHGALIMATILAGAITIYAWFATIVGRSMVFVEIFVFVTILLLAWTTGVEFISSGLLLLMAAIRFSGATLCVGYLIHDLEDVVNKFHENEEYVSAAMAIYIDILTCLISLFMRMLKKV